MIIKANIQMALRSLWGSKQRSFLALIGISIGIGSVIAMVSVGTIVQNEAISQFKELGTDFLTIDKEWAEDKRKISFEEANMMGTYIPSLSGIAPFVNQSDTITIGGNQINTGILGVTEVFQSVNRFQVTTGRFVSDLDINMPFCVIGDEIRVKLADYGMSQPIGQKLKIKKQQFTVIGILQRVPRGGMRPFDVNESILIPITTAIRNFEYAEINSMVARMKPDISSAQVKGEVDRYFDLNLKGMNARINSAEQLIGQLEKQMKMFRLMLGAIGSISLIVGGVGVMNVMLVSVSERRQEIGIRRALGAKQGDIQTQFIIESLVLSLIGGAMGISGGVLSSYIISNANNWQFIIAQSSIILGAGVSTAVGLFFGFYPARQAAKLDPITALRSS